MQIELDNISKQGWTELLQQFNDATVFQTWSYGAIRWGDGHLSHLVVKEDGRPIAAAQVRIIQIPVLHRGIAYVTYAPLWRRKDVPENSDVFRLALQVLKQEYARKRKLFLRINPNLLDEQTTPFPRILKEEGFRRNSHSLPHRTLILDLSPSLDELRGFLKQKWRNSLNKAMKGIEELEIKNGTDVKLFEKFIVVYRDMYRQKKFAESVHPEEFLKIQCDLHEAQKLQVMIVEQHNEPIAGIVCSVIGDKAFYLLGASNDRGRQTKSSYILQWQMIEWLKHHGIRWYDLGGIDPEANPGTYRFKLGIAGKKGRDLYYLGMYDVSFSWASSMLVFFTDHLTMLLRVMRQRIHRIRTFFSK